MTDALPKDAEAARHQDPKSSRRSAARLAAVQLLYQLDFRGNDKSPTQALQEYSQQLLLNRQDNDGEEGLSLNPDLPLLKEVLLGVIEHQAEIDPLVESHLSASWTMQRLDPVVLACLRAGVFELKYLLNVPEKVIISEYADVAAAFVQEQEVGFVNSLLDGLAKALRPTPNSV